MRLIAVAVPVPSLDALTYSVPDAFALPSIGARVLVPLGNRALTGIVVGIVDPAPRRRVPTTRTPTPNLTEPNPEPGTPNLNPNPEPGTRNRLRSSP